MVQYPHAGAAFAALGRRQQFYKPTQNNRKRGHWRMQSWLQKLEYKYGRRGGIPNLMIVLIAGQLLLYVAANLGMYNLLSMLTLTRSGLAHLQIWRLITFVFLPSSSSNPLFFLLYLYCEYWIGMALERAWGNFRFTVYVAACIVGAWLACLLTGSATNMGIYYSLFFGFACLYPDQQLLLFFVIPIKVKWIGLFSGALYLLQILAMPGLLNKLSLILALSGFLLFFGPDLWQDGFNRYRNYKRRRDWENQWKNR